jgi:hypothetical protein
MTSCSERVAVALSVGPAVTRALTVSASTLTVRGVFNSAVHLQMYGTGLFVTLCGRRGEGLPHAIVLDQEPDGGWGLPIGATGRQSDGSITLAASDGTVQVDLARARRWPRRDMPAIGALGAAHRAAVAWLAAIQRDSACALRIDALYGSPPASALGARLRNAAVAVTTLLCDPGASRATLQPAIAALVGLGPGLTPAGDDFLCGLLAAATAADASGALVDKLAEATVPALARTPELSAFLIRCAIHREWPTPLLDLGKALVGDRTVESTAAVAALCSIGHSSGADLASGFLHGLEVLAARR